jgi:hypothetical protein
MNNDSRFSRKTSLPRAGPARPFGSLPKLDERVELKRCIINAENAVKERKKFVAVSGLQARRTINAVGDIWGDPAAACEMNAWLGTRMADILGQSSDDAPEPPSASVSAVSHKGLPALRGVKPGVARFRRSDPGPVKEESLEDLRRRHAELVQLFHRLEYAVTLLVDIVEYATDNIIEPYVQSDSDSVPRCFADFVRMFS